LELFAHCAKVRALYPINHPLDWRKSLSPRHGLLSRVLGWQPSDTPSASVYRIYQFFIFVLGWNVPLCNELEYSCCSHPDWAVCALPDHADLDPLQYVVLAVL
ncbi:hypothetical protein BU15DRAFT_34595, partial [Melanogaster broomeanus]